jgi:hypothetical protein
MTNTIAVIPLDDRSVNYECVAILGEAAGLHVLLPPKAWLGTPWRTGQTDKLIAWLRENAAQAGALVVAVDTVGYGGLVNSRRSADPLDTVMARLEVLRQIKQAQPATTILAFNVLMRINRGNDAEEEKAYWAIHGERLFRLSVLEDRAAMAVATPGEVEELAHLRPQLPPEILDDYLGGRARNHAVNLQMVEWTAQGIFDYLIVPQDDTVAYGWNIAEARRLRQLVVERGLTNCISTYPGTDETGMLLLARYVAARAGFQPHVWLRYSGSGADQVITAYEDRPMTEMVKAHLGPLGGVIAQDAAQADLLLYINAPAEAQGNGAEQYVLALTNEQIDALPAATRQGIRDYRRQPHVATTLREMHTVRRDLPEFVRSLDQALAANRTCAVVDVAFVNAGDVVLGDLLSGMEHLSQLAAYGGWNTAGNTLGCVLAQAVIRYVQLHRVASADALAAHMRFLFLRLVEDYLYMGRIRTQIMVEDLPSLGLEPTMGNLGDHAVAIRAIVERRLRAAAQELAKRRFIGHTLSVKSTVTIDALDLANISLPWDRLFDLTMDVDLQQSAGTRDTGPTARVDR